MIRITLITALIAGYMIGWATDSKPAPAHPVEYLMRDGKPTFESSGHGFVLRPGYTDAKVQLAALQIACHAIRGCRQ